MARASLNKRYLVLGVLLAASMGLLLFVLLSGEESSTRATRDRTRREGRRASADRTPAAPPLPNEVDWARYDVVLKRGVFGQAPAPAQGRSGAGPGRQGLPSFQPATPTLSGPVAPVVPPQPPPEPAPSFSGWTYSGFVEVDGKAHAILRNDAERMQVTVTEGEAFRGGTVAKITPQEVRLRAGSRETALARPEWFPLLPLDKTAVSSGTESTPQPQGPPQRGQG